jgi:hypothetical protein
VEISHYLHPYLFAISHTLAVGTCDPGLPVLLPTSVIVAVPECEMNSLIYVSSIVKVSELQMS